MPMINATLASPSHATLRFSNHCPIASATASSTHCREEHAVRYNATVVPSTQRSVRSYHTDNSRSTQG